MDNENIVTPEIPDDDTEKLLEKYDTPSRRRPDDVPAMQAVVCIVAVAVIFGLNIFYPETAGEVFGKIKRLAFSGREIMPNPINLIERLF